MKRQDHLQGNGKIAHTSTFAYSNDSDYLIRTMSITLLALSPLLIVKVVSDRFGSFRLPFWQGVFAWNRRSEQCDARCE